VQEEHLTSSDTAHRVRYPANPASVPGARRFVARCLEAIGRGDLVDDAMLCASELAGNAALHSECTYIEVAVETTPDGVRLVVDDDGPVSMSVVAPRTTLPGLDDSFDVELDELDLLLADQPATGRGLAIVTVLARDWGVQELPQGKRVWAELAEDGAGAVHRAKERRSAEQRSAELPAGWATVRLAGSPASLVRRHDQHLDELVRELKLMLYANENPGNVAIARRLRPVVDASDYVRLTVRRDVDAALARGESVVDVDLSMPSEFSREIRLLDDALREADALSAERRLLTLPAAPDVQALRAWLSAQIVGQIERGATPVSWQTWQSQRAGQP
jgi:anti-sigma regulatory factor (Ser/Thr protein kinase)